MIRERQTTINISSTAKLTSFQAWRLETLSLYAKNNHTSDSNERALIFLLIRLLL